MSPISLRPDDAPEEWRSAIRLLGFVVGLLVSGFVLYAGLTAIIRNEARAETRIALSQDLDAFKKAALEAAEKAAREGAQAAVRDAVAPLGAELARAQERDQALKERVEWLENRRAP